MSSKYIILKLNIIFVIRDSQQSMILSQFPLCKIKLLSFFVIVFHFLLFHFFLLFFITTLMVPPLSTLITTINLFLCLSFTYSHRFTLDLLSFRSYQFSFCWSTCLQLFCLLNSIVTHACVKNLFNKADFHKIARRFESSHFIKGYLIDKFTLTNIFIVWIWVMFYIWTSVNYTNKYRAMV